MKNGAVAAWLREGERQATDLPTAPYDRARFRDLLSDLRVLTTETDPLVFVPKLIEALQAK